MTQFQPARTREVFWGQGACSACARSEGLFSVCCLNVTPGTDPGTRLGHGKHSEEDEAAEDP